MSERLRIAVTGLAATYPLGGVFWDYLQYPLGFHQLGHDVLFIEDTGQWCYDPTVQTFVGDGTNNAKLLAESIRRVTPELSDRWYFRDAENRCFGRSTDEVAAFCKSADLFLNISATCWMRDEYFAARRIAFLDSDPMYTQASIPDYVVGNVDDKTKKRIDDIRRHDVFFSFGENVGQQDCRIPTELFAWKPTRQPIVMDRFEAHRVSIAQRRKAMATVASWEPAQKGPIVRGVQYWGKSVEFQKFMELPSKLKEVLGARLSADQLPGLELAMSGRAPVDQLRNLGWQMVDPTSVSDTPENYRAYLAGAMGEWSVAKNAYVAARTGWFSCRSACFLALGVPVVVQDTGFSKVIPTGRGVHGFDDVNGALAAIEKLLTTPQAESQAALDIAHEYFDARKVLAKLIEQAMSK